ncbi:MAG: Ig-like domain-containing protein [Nitrospirae bacterium]|nr:Ig-like domain-containing protein [Nitrospirota bacterium]
MKNQSITTVSLGIMLFLFNVAASPGGCGGTEEKPKQTTTTATEPAQPTTAATSTAEPTASIAAPVPAKIEVALPTTALKIRDTQQLTVVVKDKDDKEVTGATVKWSSSDEKVVTVDATGKVTVVGAGNVTLKACVENVCGEATLVIKALGIPPDVAMARVVTAGSTSMSVGGGSLKGGGSVRSATLEPLPGAPPRWMGWVDGAADMGLFASPRLYVKTSDPLCDSAADPVGADGVPLWKVPTSSGIAAGTFYCLLKAEIGPPKTVPSALAAVRKPICAILKLVPYEQLKFDGAKQEIKGPKPAECYPEGGGGESRQFGPGTGETAFTGDMVLALIANRPGALGKSGSWDESFDIDWLVNERGKSGGQRKLATKSGDGWIAAASVFTTGTNTDGFAYYLDWKNGIVRFEQKTQHFDAPTTEQDCCYSTHARLLVKGKVDENGVFSEVTHFEGVHSQLTSSRFTLPGLTADPNPIDKAKLLSIRGNPKDGYKTHEYCNLAQCGQSGGATLSPLSTSSYIDKVACSGDVGATCAGNDGIKITKASDLDFTMLPSAPTYTSTTTWFNSLGVLSYDAVTWADTQ